MPPRVVAAADVGGGAGDWYASLPPVTRLWATACFASSALCYIGLLHPASLALLSRAHVLAPRLQLWRPLTSALFLAPFSLKFAFELMWILQYGAALERGAYAVRPGDFAWMLAFNALALTAVSLLAPPLGLVFVASPMVFALVYVWSRHNPDQRVSLFGMITLRSFYLPFAFLAVTVIQGGSPVNDLLGLAVGHAWYFATELHPRASGGGRRLLPTPRWADALAARLAALGGGGAAAAPAGVAFGGGGGGGGGAAGRAAAAPEPADDGRFRAFRGQGQRLGAGGAAARPHGE
jgi:Derlin-2/3